MFLNKLLQNLKSEKNELHYQILQKNEQIQECIDFIKRKSLTCTVLENLHKNFLQYLNNHEKNENIEYWINQGVNVNYKYENNLTPLFYGGECIPELLKYGADVHMLDVDNNNCLMYIMKHFGGYHYKTIVNQGIDLFHRNIHNQSIFHITKERLKDSVNVYNKKIEYYGKNYKMNNFEEEKEKIQYYKEALIYFEEKGRKILKDLLTKYLYEELVEIILFFSF
jgi:hypothetical protein